MKKWLQVIGWTLLTMVIYYIIEEAIHAAFRQPIETADSNEQYSQYILFANTALKAVTLLVFGFWYKCREGKKNIRPDYRGALNIKTFLCLAGIGFFGQYAAGFLLTLLRVAIPSIFEDYEKITQAVSLDNRSPFLMAFLVGVLGPIAEEFLFRGVIYGKLRDVFTVAQAAVISGAIFGIYHKNVVQGIYAALFGILLADIFEKTQTIWGAIVMHMIFNLSSYFVLWLERVLNQHEIYLSSLSYLLLDIVSIILVVRALLSLSRRPNRYDNSVQ